MPVPRLLFYENNTCKNWITVVMYTHSLSLIHIFAMESLRPQESQLVVTLQDAKRMFDEVNSPNLKILIDTTAMSVQGETIDDWFDMFGEDVWHTHFIDSNPYGHLAWGFGNRSMKEYLEALNRHHYTGYLGQVY